MALSGLLSFLGILIIIGATTAICLYAAYKLLRLISYILVYPLVILEEKKRIK